MAKPEWGTKRVCQTCSGIYYDFKKVPAVCPTCSTKFDPEALLRSRRGRTMPDDGAGKPELETETPKDELAVLEEDALVDEVEDEEEEDALIEDASELGEDDDDVGVPVVGTDDDR